MTSRAHMPFAGRALEKKEKDGEEGHRRIHTMKILTASDLPLNVPVAVALGFFDGVHKGHRALLAKLVEQPEASLIYTFARKPNVPKPLFTPEERASIAASDGIDYFYCAPFDANMKDLSPRSFVRQLTREFDVRTIVVGSDFRFGSGAAGDAELLKEMSAKFKYQLVVVPVRGEEDKKYSSSDLRSYIAHGEIEKANDMMGRCYFVDGVVEHGSRLGQKIGFPTANVTRIEKVLPPHGVYATLTCTRDGLFPSVTNVGIRPTVDDGDFENIETNLLDHTEELYGQPIRIYFLKRMRPEHRFANVAALKEQIGSDARQAGEIVASLRDTWSLTPCEECAIGGR